MASLTQTAFAVMALALAVRMMMSLLYTRLPVHVDGKVDERFRPVQENFRKNFLDGWERDGAAFSVYYQGSRVVDIWGGYADTQAARRWDSDTLTVTFSTTKAVAAICIAMLVERGRVAYEDRLVKFWPKFGQHGKDNVTVQWVLAHMSGLTSIDSPISVDDARDPHRMSALLEAQPPTFPPGTATGYQVYTYGWLIDQIVRRVDEKQRSVGMFFREEIAIPHGTVGEMGSIVVGIDFFIGLPQSEQWRVARITAVTWPDLINEIVGDWRVSRYLLAYGRLLRDTPLARAVQNPSWLEAVTRVTYNNPDYQRLEQAASFGIGNARSLAKLFALLAGGKIVNATTLHTLVTPVINETDVVTVEQVAKGHGFLFFPRNRGKNDGHFLVGHPGHGGQMVVFDTEHQLSMAYVTNGLKMGLGDLCRTYTRLKDAVYDVIEAKKG